MQVKISKPRGRKPLAPDESPFRRVMKEDLDTIPDGARRLYKWYAGLTPVQVRLFNRFTRLARGIITLCRLGHRRLTPATAIAIVRGMVALNRVDRSVKVLGCGELADECKQCPHYIAIRRPTED